MKLLCRGIESCPRTWKQRGYMLIKMLSKSLSRIAQYFVRHSRKSNATDRLYDQRRFNWRLLFPVVGFLHPRGTILPKVSNSTMDTVSFSVVGFPNPRDTEPSHLAKVVPVGGYRRQKAMRLL